MNRTVSFEEHIHSNNNNFGVLTKEFPKLILAAEYINDIFDQIFGDRFIHDNQILWQLSTAQMLFGIHYCWLNYFLQTAQGYNDIGLMIGRRAIEYTCYISKIVGKEKYAELWNEKSINKEKSLKFSSKFSIPKTYFTTKYEKLNPLLVLHDFMSEFGSHGNHATLISKFESSKFRNKISMSFHDAPKGIPHSCGVSIQAGSFIIDALLHYLKDNIREYKSFRKSISVKDQIISEAMAEIIQFTDNNDPNFRGLNITSKDNIEIEGLYNNLKEKYCTP